MYVVEILTHSFAVTPMDIMSKDSSTEQRKILGRYRNVPSADSGRKGYCTHLYPRTLAQRSCE